MGSRVSGPTTTEDITMHIIESKLARLENDGSVSYGINSGYRITRRCESFAEAKARLAEMKAQYPKSKHVIKAA